MAERNGSGLAGVAPALLLDDPGFLRGIGERALPAILEAEMTAHLGAARDERGEGRPGHRNGYRPRTLTTRVGTLELRVPQDRDGTFSTEVFARYQRSEQALVTTWMEMVPPGRLHPERGGDHRGVGRNEYLQEPGVCVGGAARPRTPNWPPGGADP